MIRGRASSRARASFLEAVFQTFYRDIHVAGLHECMQVRVGQGRATVV